VCRRQSHLLPVLLSRKGEKLSEETNIKLIQEAYQTIKAGDIPSFLNILAENVLWIVPGMPNVPFSGTWQGRQQVEQFFGQTAEVQDVVEFEPEEFIAQREKVVVLGTFHDACEGHRQAVPLPMGTRLESRRRPSQLHA
jgi:ketosteroid isomerase-like protein